MEPLLLFKKHHKAITRVTAWLHCMLLGSLQVWILLAVVRPLLLIPKQDYFSPENRTYHFSTRLVFTYPIRLVALRWKMYGTWKSGAQYCFSRWRMDERWVINRVISDCFAYLLKGLSCLMPLWAACLSKYCFVFFKRWWWWWWCHAKEECYWPLLYVNTSLEQQI